MAETGPLQIGLTGGIAAGKSLVGDRLAQLGAVLVDHDLLAREAVAPGSIGLQAVVDHFGTQILLPDGQLDRQRLGQLIFADEQARLVLNSIVHPAVRAAAAQIAAQADREAVVVQMIPLLVETGQQNDFDLLVVVDVPQSVQLARLMDRNGLSRAQAQARIDAQASREQRLAVADHVIDNSGTPEETLRQVDQMWTEICKMKLAGFN